jgi:muconolactone D-isomerase
MEFLFKFEAPVPDGTPEAEVKDRKNAAASASAMLGQGRLVRPWRPAATSGNAVGVYRADSPPQLDSLLGALPLHDWLQVTVTPLEPRPIDHGRRV